VKLIKILEHLLRKPFEFSLEQRWTATAAYLQLTGGRNS